MFFFYFEGFCGDGREGQLTTLWDNLLGPNLLDRGVISDVLLCHLTDLENKALGLSCFFAVFLFLVDAQHARCLNAVDTFKEPSFMGVMPVVNENGTVSVSVRSFSLRTWRSQKPNRIAKRPGSRTASSSDLMTLTLVRCTISSTPTTRIYRV